jgi:hypothetical protein
MAIPPAERTFIGYSADSGRCGRCEAQAMCSNADPAEVKRIQDAYGIVRS